MERVQYQQEQMLAELKDLVQKGLFTQKETKHIMQKRTAFETALVRRIPKKGDFLRYAAYEMGLEALRRKRVERLKLGKQPPSVSDYALVRRQFHIFERALKKFKGDVGLWIQYIQVAKKEGARTLVGRITARALQLHPNVPALYILAASHELEHLSPSAARALLQRGIRLNADSVEMWQEYVKMELGFVESLRRRWDVLGIKVGADKPTGKEKGKGSDRSEGDQGDVEMNEAEVDGMQVDAEEEGEEGEAARREIMQGAIVKSVISSAVKALPKIALFTSLHSLLASFPCPLPLRTTLLDHLFALLHTTLPSNPAAIKLSATRSLTPELEGEALIDALKAANEQLASAVRDHGEGEEKASEPLASMYAEFVEEWCRKDIDESLKGYLITSLQLLAQRKSATPSPALLAATIRLLALYSSTLHAYLPPSSNTPEKIIRLSRKWTGKNKSPVYTSAKVWLTRLEAETQLSASEDEIASAWDEARGAVEGEAVAEVWLWGVERPEISDSASVRERVRLLERLLGDCKRIRDAGAWSTVHETLLVRYAESTHAELTSKLREATYADRVDDVEEAKGIPVRTHERTLSEGSPGALGPETQSVTRSPKFGPASTALIVAVADARAARVRHIAQAYLPSAAVWKAVFAQEADAAADMTMCSGPSPHPEPYLSVQHGVLETVYEYWRRKDGVDATVGWAEWLLGHGKAREAKDIVMRARSWLSTEEAREVERRWKMEMDDAAGSAEGSDA